MTYIRLRIGIAAELGSVVTFDFRPFCETKTHDPADAEGAQVLRESFERSKRKIEAVPKSFWTLIKWPIKFPKAFR